MSDRFFRTDSPKFHLLLGTIFAGRKISPDAIATPNSFWGAIRDIKRAKILHGKIKLYRRRKPFVFGEQDDAEKRSDDNSLWRRPSNHPSNMQSDFPKSNYYKYPRRNVSLASDEVRTQRNARLSITV